MELITIILVILGAIVAVVLVINIWQSFFEKNIEPSSPKLNSFDQSKTIQSPLKKINANTGSMTDTNAEELIEITSSDTGTNMSEGSLTESSADIGSTEIIKPTFPKKYLSHDRSNTQRVVVNPIDELKRNRDAITKFIKLLEDMYELVNDYNNNMVQVTYAPNFNCMNVLDFMGRVVRDMKEMKQTIISNLNNLPIPIKESVKKTIIELFHINKEVISGKLYYEPAFTALSQKFSKTDAQCYQNIMQIARQPETTYESMYNDAILKLSNIKTTLREYKSG